VLTYNLDGRVSVEGEVREGDRPARLSYTWHPLYDDGLAAEVPSRVTFELEEVRGQTRLRVVHDRFPAGSAVRRHFAGGGVRVARQGARAASSRRRGHAARLSRRLPRLPCGQPGNIM
jgi:uncharacterized protein YndB with AHSA1/START domain